MAEWLSRAEITADVVFFRYTQEINEKSIPEVFVWDLDKTYLDTAFESLSGMVRTIAEKAFQKRNVPGTATLVRALRNRWQERHPTSRDFPIYFITASPPQMERKIHAKLNYDGIYPFGIFCKDNLKNIRPGRLWRLTQQVGYKLQALLQLRLHLSTQVRQVLWGDDSELDAVIYSLYSDICSRRLEKNELRQILKHFKVVGQQVETILRFQEVIPVGDPVEKIYINLAADTDPEYYLKFGRRIMPTYNFFQTALDLYQDGRLELQQVLQVAVDLVQNYQFTVDELEKSLQDLVKRPALSKEAFAEVVPVLKAEGLLSDDFEPVVFPRAIKTRVGDRVFELEDHTEPWIPPHIDYLHDYR